MKRALIWPLLVATAITGCTTRAEVAYERATKAAAVESGSDETPVAARQRSHRDESHTTFRLAVDGSPLAEPAPVLKTERPVSELATPPSVINVDPSSQTINVGAVNVHIGDVHHHVHFEQTLTVVDRTVVTEAPVAEPPSPQAVEGERCERLRREHEARVSRWNRLFAEPPPAAAGRRR